MFTLKVQLFEQICLFELSWGQGQQLNAKLSYPKRLTQLYQNWQRIYLSFYKSQLRGRVQTQGTMVAPPINWHSKLVQAEAEFVYEFHHWLRSSELYEIRNTLLNHVHKSAEKTIDIFLTCSSQELERLPWEIWELGSELGQSERIRIARTPLNIRQQNVNCFQRKTKILVILGDDTGLNFQADKAAVKTLSRLAEIKFIGWQPDQNIIELKQKICQHIASQSGWDILLFAGHSNETSLTGGELGIAPNASLSIKEITPYLLKAKENGLQFALFNSCSGLSIAQSLIDLGLSQVAIFREPIHNRVAQVFLISFLQALGAYKDVHEALITASLNLKINHQFEFPSAYLVPSLFRYPTSSLFRLQPWGVKHKFKHFIPTKLEAVSLVSLICLSWQIPVQDLLIEKRIYWQAVCRDFTDQVTSTDSKKQSPPVLLIQIDEDSIRKAKIADPNPMDRQYLAKLVNKLNQLDAKVVGIDYLLDRHTGNKDLLLAEAIQAGINKKNSTWFIFGTVLSPETAKWLEALPEIANKNWSLSGDTFQYHWLTMLPDPDAKIERLPFAYLLGLSYLINTENNFKSINPELNNSQDFQTQIFNNLKQNNFPRIQQLTNSANLNIITKYALGYDQFWLYPLIDFSMPPSQVYERLSAWKFLEKDPAQFPNIKEQVVIIAPGIYAESGVFKSDIYPLPSALKFWYKNASPPDPRQKFTGGEAHAYMVHHFLNNRLVIPIPDLWMILLTALLGKSITLILTKHKSWHMIKLWLFLIITAIYSLLSFQIYLTSAVLIPWLLPSVSLAVYFLPWQRQKHS